jgi:hypothetical protein
MSRAMTVPGMLAEMDDEAAATSSVASDVPSSAVGERIIVVANPLPVLARRRAYGRGWAFSWDEDSLLLLLRDGVPDDMDVLFVGTLRADVPASEQDEVSQALIDGFAPPSSWPPTSTSGSTTTSASGTSGAVPLHTPLVLIPVRGGGGDGGAASQ